MSEVIIKENLYELVRRATDNYSKILPTTEIKEKYPNLYWGGNGVGDRWASKKFNYSVIYSKKQPTLYSENDYDKIPTEALDQFLQTNKGVGIQQRPISKHIHKQITSESCVVCRMWNNRNNMRSQKRLIQ